MIWLAGYLALVVAVVALGMRRDTLKQRARNRDAQRLRGEVESVPVHADGMTQNGVRNHVG